MSYQANAIGTERAQGTWCTSPETMVDGDTIPQPLQISHHRNQRLHVLLHAILVVCLAFLLSLMRFFQIY
jgi:hypothetical protein